MPLYELEILSTIFHFEAFDDFFISIVYRELGSNNQINTVINKPEAKYRIQYFYKTDKILI